MKKRSELRPEVMMQAWAHWPRERSLKEMEVRSSSNHGGFWKREGLGERDEK